MRTAALLLGLVTGMPAQAANIPLPDSLDIAEQPDDVPKDLGKFAGAWGDGAWEGLLPHVLIVESIDRQGNANIIYATGAASDWNARAGWQRLPAKVENDALTLALRGGRVRVEYRVTAQGQLAGRYQAGDKVSTVTLTKIPINELLLHVAQIPDLAPLAAETLFVPIEVAYPNGTRETVKLETTLYKPPGEAPRPLLVLNHGSTGGGAIPAQQTLRYETVARVFVERGYAVAVPMRRGRGASEGDNGETDTCQPADLDYSFHRAIEDVDGVLAFFRQQPYVDPTRMLIGGISGGGILAAAYAAQRPGSVVAAVNFSGGWVGENCPTDFNASTFAAAGKAGVPPMLWLYAEQDRYYSPVYIRRNFDLFTAAGGRATLRLYPPIGTDGHALWSFPRMWRDDLDAWLRQIGLPAAK